MEVLYDKSTGKHFLDSRSVRITKGYMNVTFSDCAIFGFGNDITFTTNKIVTKIEIENDIILVRGDFQEEYNQLLTSGKPIIVDDNIIYNRVEGIDDATLLNKYIPLRLKLKHLSDIDLFNFLNNPGKRKGILRHYSMGRVSEDIYEKN